MRAASMRAILSEHPVATRVGRFAREVVPACASWALPAVSTPATGSDRARSARTVHIAAKAGEEDRVVWPCYRRKALGCALYRH